LVQARGFRSRLVVDFETAFGQEPATPSGRIMPFNSNALKSSQNLSDPGTIVGTRNPVQPFLGNITVDGDIVVPVDVRAFGWWLRAMFGVPVTTEVEDFYSHVFKINDSQPSLVMEKQFRDLSEYSKFNGCKVSSFEMSFGGDGELTSTLGFMGSKESLGDSPYDSDPVSIPFTRFHNYQASIIEGGSGIADVVDGSISVDFGLDGDQYCIGDNGVRGSIPEGIVSVSGNLKCLFDNTSLLEKAIAGTKSSLQIKFTHGNYSLAFSVGELIFERNTPGIDGPAGIMVELPWKAFYDEGADESALTVELVNDIASYL